MLGRGERTLTIASCRRNWRATPPSREGRRHGTVTARPPPSLTIVGRMAAPLIEARQIEKFYQGPDGGRIQVIAPLDLSVHAGGIVALLGPSGSGKSTLLRMLTGLSKPSSGPGLWHGGPMSTRPNVAIVFQSFALFPWLTVQENVEAPLEARGVANAEREARSLARSTWSAWTASKAPIPRNFRRHEAARRIRARPRGGTGSAFHGRALLRARRAHRGKPPQPGARTVAERRSPRSASSWSPTTSKRPFCWPTASSCSAAIPAASAPISRSRCRSRATANRPPSSATSTTSIRSSPSPKLEPAAFRWPASRRKSPKHQMLPHVAARAACPASSKCSRRKPARMHDLYKLAEELHLEIDDLLPIVEAGDTARLPQRQRGRHRDDRRRPAFRQRRHSGAEGDLSARPRSPMCCCSTRSRAPSTTRADRTMPIEFFRDLLDEHFSDGRAHGSSKPRSTGAATPRIFDLRCRREAILSARLPGAGIDRKTE